MYALHIHSPPICTDYVWLLSHLLFDILRWNFFFFNLNVVGMKWNFED